MFDYIKYLAQIDDAEDLIAKDIDSIKLAKKEGAITEERATEEMKHDIDVYEMARFRRELVMFYANEFKEFPSHEDIYDWNEFLCKTNGSLIHTHALIHALEAAELAADNLRQKEGLF
jgi:hypothetical protein